MVPWCSATAVVLELTLRVIPVEGRTDVAPNVRRLVVPRVERVPEATVVISAVRSGSVATRVPTSKELPRMVPVSTGTFEAIEAEFFEVPEIAPVTTGKLAERVPEFF